MNKNFLTVLTAAFVAIVVHFLFPVKQQAVSVSSGLPQESMLEKIKKTGTLRCGYVGWPPYYELDPNTKRLSGFFKDMSDAVLSLTGWKVEYIEVVGGQEVEDLKRGKIDAMCGTGPWYMNSLKEVNYTRPLSYAAAYVFAREDETRFVSLADLDKPNVTFSTIEGDVSTELAARFYGQANKLTLAGTVDPAQLFLNVVTRKADVVITDPVSVALFNKTNERKLKSLFPDKPVAVYGMEFAVKKGETELLETLNGYSDMALNMNMIDPILKKYDPSGTLFLSVQKEYR